MGQVAMGGAIRGSTAVQPKPALVALFERVAAIMELDEGLTRLELEFDGGHLRRWSTHDDRNGHEALRQFDARVGRADLTAREACKPS
jgi:hypothetical protein